MKKRIAALLLSMALLCMSGCAPKGEKAQIAATTMPVYCFTQRLCQGTPLTVTRLVTENVSCLHDYSLQVGQMRAIEQAELIVISGAGLEEFLQDALHGKRVCEAAGDMELLEGGHDHDHDHGHDHAGHMHEEDPHIWLSPENAKEMAHNICHSLCQDYPQYTDIFQTNLAALEADLDALQAYGELALADLSCREIITFHDGFSYLAESFDLTILEAVEEESGSEASAKELIHLIGLVQEHELPAIFVEANGSTSAASIIRSETGVKVFTLDMAMAGDDYLEAMYRNIDVLKEALGK
ncbi:MAG: zinc ABC transporter substrate-binding protein [Oscillospiraceae bacterium]|nr:zinc ABC transporter substrate-binding protein [Oscillospiraceae bacterium]